MFSLKDHPFAVETFFESSIVLTFAVPVEELRSLLPVCLTPDTFDEKWGFVAVAMVSTKKLRPKGFPEFLGNDFFLIGYRVFVRYKNTEGKNLRGLYILKSETDKKKMSFFGNIFTHYKYTTTDIKLTKVADRISVVSEKSGLGISLRTGEEIQLPTTSPFKDWKEARRFAGPLPFTFTVNNETNEVLIIEGVRESWIPKPVEVLSHKIHFLDQKGFKEIVLANAFIIENIPYYWKKGKKEIWKP
ncbi:MAG: DUF2071 domain-containing protein [Bacteroidota bacterium]|nr:DUF2071 domain-containing protein [Bacteroidota bacterium]